MAPYQGKKRRAWTVCTSCYTDAASASWIFTDRIGRHDCTHCRCGAAWVASVDPRANQGPQGWLRARRRHGCGPTGSP
eukprot:5676530-Lingulodinium_polyedra.AAC.1